ncbi:MAG: 30S ribosomal protein S1 [Clostridia bacterium]|nr:30S ribosomal protein S1 [Clostridia bacterium]
MQTMKDVNIKFTQYKRGDIITGTIVMITKRGAIVNIGGMKDGIVPIDELDTTVYKEDDAILVMVTDKVDEYGCIVLDAKNVNKAIEQREKIKDLKVGSTFSFTVKDVATSGIKGEMFGYTVFLPYSQCSKDDYVSRDNLKEREIDAVIIELNSLTKSIVCSTKLLQKTVDYSKIDININDIVTGVPIKVMDKYAIIMLKEGLKGKLNIQDASYEHINSLNEVIEENKEYEFKVLDKTIDNAKISLGLKQLRENPLDAVFDEINLGDEHTGVVERIYPSGAMIKLDNGLTAFAKTSENSENINTATHHIYKLGATVNGYISNIDKENHKLNIITLKKKEQ